MFCCDLLYKVFFLLVNRNIATLLIFRLAIGFMFNEEKDIQWFFKVQHSWNKITQVLTICMLYIQLVIFLLSI